MFPFGYRLVAPAEPRVDQSRVSLWFTEQLLEVHSKDIRAAGSFVNRGSAAFGGRRKFSRPELKRNDTQRMIVFAAPRLVSSRF